MYLQERYPHNKPLDGKVLRGKLERNGAGGVLVALEDSGEHGVEDGRVDHHGPFVLAAEVGIGRAEAVWGHETVAGSAAKKSRAAGAVHRWEPRLPTRGLSGSSS